MSKIVFWNDKGEIERQDIETTVTSYDLGTLGIWESVISQEDKKVKNDKVEKITIKKIKLPPRAIVIPCIFKRHALGYVESVGSPGKAKKIEEDREIKEVYFRPVSDGEIKTDDLLAVLNVLYARPKGEPSQSEMKWFKRRRMQP